MTATKSKPRTGRKPAKKPAAKVRAAEATPAPVASGPKLYKVLADGRSCHGGDLAWPLPTADGPGEWVEYAGKLQPCSAGLHVTTEPAKWFDRSGLSVYEAEVEGEQVACDDDKRVCRKVRLVRLLTEAELAAVAVFTTGTHTVKSGHARAIGNATVKAWGNATVKAWGNATVKAGDNATVKAWGNATVEAWGNATVKAWGNATVNKLSHRVKCELLFLAVELDRSTYGKVVVRHTAGAAVTLEPVTAKQEAPK